MESFLLLLSTISQRFYLHYVPRFFTRPRTKKTSSKAKMASQQPPPPHSPSPEASAGLNDDNMPFRYSELAAELRSMIRKNVIADLQQEIAETPHLEISKMRHRMTDLACVSSEWQDDVEKITFASLALYKNHEPGSPTTDGKDFYRIVTGSRRFSLTRLSIWMHVDRCYGMSGTTMPSENDAAGVALSAFQRQVFISSIQRIFGLLSRWRLADVNRDLLSVSIHFSADSAVRDLDVSHDFGYLNQVEVIGGLHIRIPPTFHWKNSHRAVLSILPRLPNLHSTAFPLDDSRERPSTTLAACEIMEQVPKTNPKLKYLDLRANSVSWYTGSGFYLPDDLAERFTSSVIAIGSQLESLNLDTYVEFDLLLQSFSSGNLNHKTPAWPNMRHFSARGRKKGRADERNKDVNEFVRAVGGNAPAMMPKLDILILRWHNDETRDWHYVRFYRATESREERLAYQDATFGFDFNTRPARLEQDPAVALLRIGSNTTVKISQAAVETWEDSVSEAWDLRLRTRFEGQRVSYDGDKGDE